MAAKTRKLIEVSGKRWEAAIKKKPTKVRVRLRLAESGLHVALRRARVVRPKMLATLHDMAHVGRRNSARHL